MISLMTCVIYFNFIIHFIILVLVLINSIFYDFVRNLVREIIKKCNVISYNLYLFGFIPFVISEAILFISVFWSYIHFISSPFFSFQELLFLPDPCELTYG